MKTAYILAPLALFALFSLPAGAAEDHSKHDMSKPAASAAQSHHGTGTVKSVNANKGKATINHDPIPSLQWPGMVMDFAIPDKKALASLKPGQKVEFELMKNAEGAYVISKIAPAK